MAGTSRPATPEELVQTLSGLVPPFSDEWVEDREDEDEAPTFHRVMRTFTYVLGVACGSLSDSQLKALGHYLNECVSVDDDLENAVATCLLEHLHQIGALDALWPHLSPRARSECHA